MTERGDKIRQTLLEKYGSEDGLKEHYRDMKRRSMLHPNNQKGQHKGGFSNKDFAAKAGKIGGAKSKRGPGVKNQETA